LKINHLATLITKPKNLGWIMWRTMTHHFSQSSKLDLHRLLWSRSYDFWIYDYNASVVVG
jgi:hypothetical protein